MTDDQTKIGNDTNDATTSSLHVTLRWSISDYKKLKDRSFKITIETGELNTTELMGIDMLYNTDCYIAIGTTHLNFTDIKDDLPDALSNKPPSWKTPSQRLRAVIYLYWEKEQKDKEPSFEKYYNSLIEQFIEHYKSKLDE